MGLLRAQLGALPVLIAAALLLLPLPLSLPARADGRDRTEEQAYTSGLGLRTGHEDQGLGVEEDIAPPLKFRPQRKDRTIKLTVTDVAGTPVLVRVKQAGPRGQELADEFCGTEQTYRLVSKKPFEVYLYSGFCINHLWGVATSGTVTAVFSTDSASHPSKHSEHDHGQ